MTSRFALYEAVRYRDDDKNEYAYKLEIERETDTWLYGWGLSPRGDRLPHRHEILKSAIVERRPMRVDPFSARLVFAETGRQLHEARTQ